MDNDVDGTGDEGTGGEGRKPVEEKLLRAGNTRGPPDDSGFVLLPLGEGFPAGTGAGGGGIGTVVRSGNDAFDGEGNEEEDEEDDRIGV